VRRPVQTFEEIVVEEEKLRSHGARIPEALLTGDNGSGSSAPARGGDFAALDLPPDAGSEREERDPAEREDEEGLDLEDAEEEEQYQDEDEDEDEDEAQDDEAEILDEDGEDDDDEVEDKSA
jgi:hypothetical protein